MILDIFGGPGGWDEGMLSLGVRRTVGLEWDAAACSTRAAAGHATIRSDVAAYPVEPFVGKVRGLVGSPPCPPFSAAGKGEGMRQIQQVYAAVDACRFGWTDDCLRGPWSDERTPLILQPLRYVWALKPEWVALEQVPPCLGVWERFAYVLGMWGYDARAVVLCAADFGVPQTRRRALLLARRGRPVRNPTPTHTELPEPCLFGEEREAWVTMAKALGWGMDARPAPTLALSGSTSPIGGSGSLESYQREQAAGRWKLHQNNRPHGAVRGLDEPAPVLHWSERMNDVRWVLSPGLTPTQPNRRLYDAETEPAPTVAFGCDAVNWRWIHERPATTLVGSFAPDVVAAPGIERRAVTVGRMAPGSVRVTVEEAAVLQGFRADYPFRGSRSKQYQQVGNAFPPPLAAAIVQALTT